MKILGVVLKPKDVLTDPEFHKYSHEARRVIMSKVWPDFTKADPADQDATLSQPMSYWEAYYKPVPPEEPGIFKRIGQFIEKGAKVGAEGRMATARGYDESGKKIVDTVKNIIKSHNEGVQDGGQNNLKGQNFLCRLILGKP